MEGTIQLKVSPTRKKSPLWLYHICLISHSPRKQLETIKGISEQKAEKLLKEGKRCLGNR